MTTVTFPSHPDHSAGRDDALPDTDIERVLTQAMNDYERSTPGPSFDSDGIVRRTRRRRATLTLTSCAAVLAAAAGLTVTLDSSSSRPTDVASAPASTPISPTHSGVPTGLGQPGVSVSNSASDAAGKTVTVPDLIGMNQAAATHALTAVGLNVSLVQTTEPSPETFRADYPSHANLIRADGTIAPGTVIMTSVAAATRVSPGDYVSIWLVHY